MRVAFFATCLADSFFAESALAAVRVLRALGVDVVVPPGQTCCGQPAFNTGHWKEATRMAVHTARVFEEADAIVLPSGSCAAMLRCHYRELGGAPGEAGPLGASLAGRTWELTQFIVDVLGVTELGNGLGGRVVAWHHGCHAQRELGVHDQPLTLLRNAGATIAGWDAAEECCGFGGVFAVKMPEVSVAMADRKVETLGGRRADVLSSTDAGCLMQLSGRLRRRGLGLDVRHVADLLWQAMQGNGNRRPGAA